MAVLTCRLSMLHRRACEVTLENFEFFFTWCCTQAFFAFGAQIYSNVTPQYMGSLYHKSKEFALVCPIINYLLIPLLKSCGLRRSRRSGAAGIQPIVRLLSSGREAVVVAGAADGGWWGLVCELVKVKVDWKL